MKVNNSRKYNSIDLRRVDEETMEGPIVTSRIDDDFYKFLMGQFIWNHEQYRSAQVRWSFKNRTKEVQLAKCINQKEFNEQIDFVRTLMLDSTERHYLGGTYEYDERRMFEPGYLNYLANLPWPSVQFDKADDGQLDITTTGSWAETSLLEIPILRIINGLYYRKLLSQMSKMQREAIYAEGVKRLLGRIETLKEHPYVTFSDFGNRRSFSAPWHDYVVSRVIEELPNQFKGTSSTSLAMKYGVTPVGTCAHEISMIVTAMKYARGGNIAAIQDCIQNEWYQQYGPVLNISLPDTYGTEFCINAYSDETISALRGFRIDSMDPLKAIPLLQERFKKAGVDYRGKLFIPSDGLDVDSMIEISSRFRNEGIISHGFGTNLTNDMGLKQLSIVVKPISVNNEFCVKLSDNLAKAIGNTGAIAQYKKEIGYHEEYNKTCKV